MSVAGDLLLLIPGYLSDAEAEVNGLSDSHAIWS